MPASDVLAYIGTPAAVLLAIGVLVLLLRWAFRPGGSLVQMRDDTAGDPADYGLLVPVASPSSEPEAGHVRGELGAAGIRCVLARTRVGLRILVWPEDAGHARAVLRHHGTQQPR